MRSPLRRHALALALAGVFLMAPAMPRGQPTGPVEQVRLEQGATTIRGTIRGDASRLFEIDLAAGDRLRVTLESRNASANINVWAPGTDTAMFIGSSQGPEFVGPVPMAGPYRIDLYLMRSAARRNETAPFTLTIAVEAR